MDKKISCDILIQNTSFLKEDFEIIDNCYIAVKDGKILEVASDEKGKICYEALEIVEGSGKLWMPGLVDGHMHTGQQLLKGAVLDELPMIWTRIMLPFESTLTPQKMKLSAELAALEMIKNGTTGFVDAGGYYMDTAAEVYLKSGLRGAISHSAMDQGNFPDSIRQTTEEVLEEEDRLYDSFHGEGNLKVYYSLRALMNCSEKLICASSERARERGTFLQAHMNEYPGEVNYTLEKYQLRPVEYLDKLGILGSEFLIAHGIFLSSREKECIADRQAKIVHCPFSNCGKGIPDTPDLLQRGISVGLGTDGAAHGGLSLWNEMKIFRSVMNAVWGVTKADPAVMPAKTILKMVTFHGNSFLGQIDSETANGKQTADLISIDWTLPNLLATCNRVNTILECVTGSDVSDCMVNGRFLMRNRQVLTLDEEKILWQARKYYETGDIVV